MAEPIRIAEIVGRWVGGGVEAVIMNYYQNIDKTRVQFDLICDSDSTDIPYKKIEELGGRVFLIPPYTHIKSYRKELTALLKKNNYTVIHSHINTLSLFPLSAAKSAGVPVRIAHSHSTTNKLEKKRNLIKMVLRPFSRVFPTDYICCSELSGRWLFGDRAYDRGEVYLLNNATDLSRFTYNEDVRKSVREELGIAEGVRVIGHMGRFVTQKNHSRLVDIFAEIHKKDKSTLLVIAGQGPLKEEISQKIKALGLDGCVMMLGQRDDAYRLYQGFDLFLLPSLYEGLPVVGVESQAAGLPCLFSDDMTKETGVLESTRFMSLSEGDSVWAEAALEMLSSHKRRDTTREMTESGFNIKCEAEKLTQLYLKLAGECEK